MSNKERIIELLKSTGREGIDKLIEHMEDIGFFTAPCSTQHHLCKVGGLSEHSLNVYMLMDSLNQNALNYNGGLHHSVITSGILHDLGKATYRDKQNYIPNILKSGSASKDKPYITNPDRLYIPHETVSVIIASQFIELTEEEEFAILYHNGMYVSSGRDISGKERPLQLLLHFADMWCSRFIEVGKEEKE